MKKSLFKLITTILMTGGVLTLTACDFFLNGEDLKKELDQQIAYNNAPSVSVYLKADAELGEFLSDGEKSFKVGYDTEVQFTVNQESYVFEKLEAVVRNSPETSRSDSVQFTEVESDAKKGIYKINVKVLKQVNDIMIRPVCKALPKISGITPALDVTGCLQDSEITISFNKKMDTESFKDENGKIKGITITTSDGEDLSEYFDEAIFDSDNKSLTILPLCLIDDTKYLLPPDGTKNNLNIEVSYTFINVKDADGLEFTENGTHSYKINKNFSDQESVTVVVQNPVAAYGSFLSSGEKTCIVRFGFDIEFTLNKEAYIFQGFEAISQNNVLDESYVSFENRQYDDETGIYKARVRVYKTASDILIRPKCTLIENAEVTITQREKGTKKISPYDGTKVQSFINRWYSVSMTPDDDCVFICWELYDLKTDSSIANGTYVTLEDPTQPSTNYSVTQVPDNGIELALRPVVAERPQIISYSPMTLDELKDSSIQVLFDHDMDEGSIYYSDDELESLIAKVGKENLLVSDKREGKYYGYKKDGKTFFKNISFEDNDSYENITECFDEPFFATPRMLNINTSKENKLPDFTQVLVTIENDFFYKAEGANRQYKNISMWLSKKWVYQVNDMEDTDAPRVVNDDDVNVSINSGENLSELTQLTAAPNTPAVSESTLFNRDKKITLNIKVTDTGSGPASNFILALTKVQDADYKDIENSTVQKTSLNYQRVTSQNGVLNRELDLASLIEDKLSDGVYKLNFEFSDRSGKTVTYPENKSYYFTVDNQIKMAEPVFTDTSDSSSIKMKFEWTRSKDHQKTEIRYKKNSADQWSNLEEFTTDTEKEYSSLELATDYDFEITNYDYAGNKQVLTLTKTSAEWTEFSVTGTPSKTLYFSGESFDGTGLTANIELSNETSWTVDSYTTDLGTAISTGKTVTISYTYGGKTKSVELPQTYYIAASDALTQTPTVLIGYDGTNGAEDTYFKFGDYPQTIKDSSVTISTSTPIYNGWYLGNDGYFYEKCTAKICDTSGSSRKCSDGTTILTNGTVYYFKVEPIKWRYLNYIQDKGCFILAENILTANIPFNFTYNSREVNNTTIQANNYQYSTIRAWLNGKTEDGDTGNMTYQNNGFLQKAFTTTAQIKIKETTVAGTPEKIFLLSNNGINYSNYGFDKAKPRIRKPTDYAIANEAYKSIYSSEGGFWWLRDAYSDVYSDSALYVSRQGSATTDNYNKVTNALGIVPALYVDFDIE